MLGIWYILRAQRVPIYLLRGSGIYYMATCALWVWLPVQTRAREICSLNAVKPLSICHTQRILSYYNNVIKQGFYTGH